MKTLDQMHQELFDAAMAESERLTDTAEGITELLTNSNLCHYDHCEFAECVAAIMRKYVGGEDVSPEEAALAESVNKVAWAVAEHWSKLL